MYMYVGMGIDPHKRIKIFLGELQDDVVCMNGRGPVRRSGYPSPSRCRCARVVRISESFLKRSSSNATLELGKGKGKGKGVVDEDILRKGQNCQIETPRMPVILVPGADSRFPISQGPYVGSKRIKRRLSCSNFAASGVKSRAKGFVRLRYVCRYAFYSSRQVVWLCEWKNRYNTCKPTNCCISRSCSTLEVEYLEVRGGCASTSKHQIIIISTLP
ncbi:hypothetical protein F5B20DRAFT_340264 [Whalleya microplaca]|nr:hypothetical protein F5B20DRAFT_340264 [Whalleya microplaca]